MTNNQLIDEIYAKLETFKNTAGSARRQYLAAASQLLEVEERLSEISNSDEDFDTEELSMLNEKVQKVLKNLGIAF